MSTEKKQQQSENIYDRIRREAAERAQKKEAARKQSDEVMRKLREGR